MNWLLSHMDDPDLDKPLEPSPSASSGGASGGESVNEEAVMMLSSMGFTREQVNAHPLTTVLWGKGKLIDHSHFAFVPQRLCVR
jgi:uncharacterized UBP type Zn finger protein